MQSGGLISIWEESILKKEDVFLSPRVLATKFRSVVDNYLWFVANTYELNEDSDRRDF